MDLQLCKACSHPEVEHHAVAVYHNTFRACSHYYPPVKDYCTCDQYVKNTASAAGPSQLTEI